MASITLLLGFVLGLLFLGTGGLKLMVPHREGMARFGWIEEVPPRWYRLAGWTEIAGAIGLMFPTMVQAVEWLTPLAAAGLALQMVLATGLHLRRREWPAASGTVILIAMLVGIAIDAVSG